MFELFIRVEAEKPDQSRHHKWKQPMKSELAIENFQEIPDDEQQGIHGGIWPIVGAIATAVVEEIIRDWDNFKNGLTGQPEEKK